MGLQSALKPEDDIIGSYRCHGIQYIRGDTVAKIVAELYGYEQGSSKGKGGSMHFYNKAKHYWGGSGIVGAQVPVGAGLAFANHYRKNVLNQSYEVVLFAAYVDVLWGSIFCPCYSRQVHERRRGYVR